MKKSTCKECSRTYWAQVESYGPVFISNEKESRRTKPKTNLCKPCMKKRCAGTGTPVTKTYEPKKRVGKRHVNRKSVNKGRRDK